MDGRGRFLDNIFIERLWRSLKYECVYLHAFSGGREARQGIGDWVELLQSSAPARRPWRRDTGQGISRKAVGLRPGLAPGPPADSLGGVTRVK